MPTTTSWCRSSTASWNWSARTAAARVRGCEQGKSYFRKAGVEHDVINAGAGLMTFVEIELKDTGGRAIRGQRSVR